MIGGGSEICSVDRARIAMQIHIMCLAMFGNHANSEGEIVLDVQRHGASHHSNLVAVHAAMESTSQQPCVSGHAAKYSGTNSVRFPTKAAAKGC